MVLTWRETLDSQSSMPTHLPRRILKGNIQRVWTRHERRRESPVEIPHDRATWDLESTLILYPSSNDQEIREKWQVLYLQKRWKSHCNNQWMQNRTDPRFPLFPPWFYIKVKKDSFVQIQEGRRGCSPTARDGATTYYWGWGLTGHGREGPARGERPAGTRPSRWWTAGTRTWLWSRRCTSWSQGWWASARCSARCCCGPATAGCGARPSASPSSTGWWSARPAAARSPPCGWRRPASGAPAGRSGPRLRRDERLPWAPPTPRNAPPVHTQAPGAAPLLWLSLSLGRQHLKSVEVTHVYGTSLETRKLKYICKNIASGPATHANTVNVLTHF